MLVAMNDDWWPDLLAHIPQEQPWASPRFVAAELRSFDDPWFPGLRTTFSALIGVDELAALNGELIHFNYQVETSGPRPVPEAAGVYRPAFWIAAGPDYKLRCEPLVLEWETNNRTALVIEPGFLMTYGLVPRAVADGSIHYDDWAVPEFDIAVIDPPSVFEDSAHSGAQVVISRDHLQDYLTLRGKPLVQVYYESRRGPRDDAIEALLAEREGATFKLRDREFQVQRRHGGGFTAQVWGARVVAGPGGLPISGDELDAEGLRWLGFDRPVTNHAARRLGIGDYAYVSDKVLAPFEGQPGFQIHPESGSVAYGNQWSVGYCDRVGRDVIRLELKKLYEGAAPRIIQHWHDHAVAPTPELLNPGARGSANVGTRAGRLVDALAALGGRLAELSDRLGLEAVRDVDLVGLDRADLDYRGWWNDPHVEPVTRHYPLDLSQDEFLARCLALDKLLIEPLSEARLRKMVRTIGVPPSRMDDFRGLKLLDRLICLAQVAVASGLPLWESGSEVATRLEADGTKPARPLDHLFALSDLRTIAAHRKGDAEARLAEALRRFGIDPATTAGGYGAALDMIYDKLAEQIATIRSTIEQAMRV
jgi:hypothetical protein